MGTPMGTYARVGRGVLGAMLAAGAVTMTTLPAAAAQDAAVQVAAATETAAQERAAQAATKQEAAGNKVVIPRPGQPLTKAEQAAMGCEEKGFGEAIGWAECTDDHQFKVRVWCTWAGEGLSDAWRQGTNWARCGIGSVNDVEIIWKP